MLHKPYVMTSSLCSISNASTNKKYVNSIDRCVLNNKQRSDHQVNEQIMGRFNLCPAPLTHIEQGHLTKVLVSHVTH